MGQQQRATRPFTFVDTPHDIPRVESLRTLFARPCSSGTLKIRQAANETEYSTGLMLTLHVHVIKGHIRRGRLQHPRRPFVELRLGRWLPRRGRRISDRGWRSWCCRSSRCVCCFPRSRLPCRDPRCHRRSRCGGYRSVGCILHSQGMRVCEFRVYARGGRCAAASGGLGHCIWICARLRGTAGGYSRSDPRPVGVSFGIIRCCFVSYGFEISLTVILYGTGREMGSGAHGLKAVLYLSCFGAHGTKRFSTGSVDGYHKPRFLSL